MLREVERERSPAATQLEDFLAVPDLSPLDIECEHCLLGLVEALPTVLEQAPRIFQAAPQAALEEPGGDLVVLLVRGARVLGDRPAFQVVDICPQPGRGIALRLVADALREEPADPDPHD